MAIADGLLRSQDLYKSAIKAGVEWLERKAKARVLIEATAMTAMNLSSFLPSSSAGPYPFNRMVFGTKRLSGSHPLAFLRLSKTFAALMLFINILCIDSTAGGHEMASHRATRLRSGSRTEAGVEPPMPYLARVKI